jgi:DNA-binding beta-propeller fold protein YncE
VADTQNNRIEKFTSNGAFVTAWATSTYFVATDASNNVYTTDLGGRVIKFNSTGTLLTQWGSPGHGEGEFFYPTGIAVDGSGNVFVAEPDEFGGPGLYGRIQKFGSIPTAVAPSSWGGIKARYR